jgi:UDP-N-acetylmuramoylalanine--D-glutamate ligase
MQAYAAAKRRLFAMQAPAATAITDRASAQNWAMPGGPATTILFSDDVALEGQSGWPALQGPHNLANARAAAAAARALGLSAAEIAHGLTTYPGLPHRMERIASRGGVLYVNDSKATNPDSTAPALAAFPNTHWIAGGKAKGADLDTLLPHLGQVRAAYLIGEAAPLFGQLLGPHLPVRQCGTLDVAVADAAAAARPGETVLLSPACASFDQFTDFEARGQAFRRLVEALA